MSVRAYSRERALLWHLWRRGWLHLTFLTGGLTLFTALAVSLDERLAPAMLGVSMICWAMHLLHLAEGKVGEGLEPGLLLLPVSHRQLSTISLVGLGGVQVFLFVAGAVALRWSVGFAAPILTAALFIGALSCWALVLIWASAHQPTLRTLVLGFPLIVVFFGARLRFGPHAWMDIVSSLTLAQWRDQVFLAGLIVVAFLVAPATIARQRRGVAVRGALRIGDSKRARLAGFGGLWENLTAIWSGLTGGAHKERPFSSGGAALGWLGLRENGRILLPMFLLPFVVVPLARLIGLFDTAEALRFVRAQTGLALFFAPFLVAGVVSKVHDGELEACLPQTIALRPLASREIAAHYLRSAAVGLFLIWCLTAMFLAAAWALTPSQTPGALPQSLLQASTKEGFVWFLLAAAAGLLVSGWLQLGWVSAVLLTGRTAMAGLLVLIPYSVAVALLVFGKSSEAKIFAVIVDQGPWLYGLAACLGVLALLARAHQLRLFPANVLVRIVLGWITLAVVPLGLPTVVGEVLRSSFGFAMWWIGASGLIVTPWVACTLAVRWNRHR